VTGDRRIVVVFSMLVVGSLVFDATHRWFWQHAHDTAPVAALVMLLLVAALLRRHAFAWWLFLILSLTSLPWWVAVRHISAASVMGLLVGLAEFGLLLSVPTRRYVGVGRWRGHQQLRMSRT
jgi:apolipoprotein N-acyltransferase